MAVFLAEIGAELQQHSAHERPMAMCVTTAGVVFALTGAPLATDGLNSIEAPNRRDPADLVTGADT
ncbi:MAG: hypothetical protein V3W41_04665 [Planctomycetota bacterium]